MAPLVPRLASGMWEGFYAQGGRRYPQDMRLEFADGLMRGDGIDDLGAFTIEGEYRVAEDEVRLGWIKTYEGAHSVLYLGVLEGEVLVGEWSIRGWGDAFELTPRRGS